MLDKQSKIILDTLINNNFIYPQSKFVSISETLIPLLPKSSKYKWTFEKLAPLLQYLKLNGYVDYHEIRHGYYPVPDCAMLFTTHKGANYKEFRWLAFQDFLYKSIVTPIAVSAITSMIAILLAALSQSK